MSSHLKIIKPKSLERVYSVLSIFVMVSCFLLMSSDLFANSNPWEFGIEKENRISFGQSLWAWWKTLQTWGLILTLPAALLIFGFMKGRGAWILFVVFLIIVFGPVMLEGLASLAGIDLEGIINANSSQ